MILCQNSRQLVVTIILFLCSSVSVAATDAYFNDEVALVGDGKCNAAKPSQFLVNYVVSGSVHDTLNDYYSMYLVDGNNMILMMSTKIAVVGKERTHVFAPSTLVEPSIGPFKFIMVDSEKKVSQKEVLGNLFENNAVIAEKQFNAHALDSDCPNAPERPAS